MTNKQDNRPYAKIKIYGIPSRGLLDSGSQLTLVSEKIFNRLNRSKLRALDRPTVVRSANGTELDILGQLSIPFNFAGCIKIIQTLVVKNLSADCILGMDFWQKFKIWPTVHDCAMAGEETSLKSREEPVAFSALQQIQLEEVKGRFPRASSDKLTMTPLCQHRIELAEEWRGKPPVRQYPYTLSPKIQERVGAELERMLSLGIIERAHSEWSSNVVPVIKPSGKVRLCLDARKINERTVRDAYPLPHPGRILGQLPQAKYLSTIDLSEAFLQIPLEPSSRKFTAFSVQGKGMFQFTRLPFGLVNSPATLARLMDRVLGHGELEPNVFVYLDDIVIVSETFEHHLRLLREVANRLAEANLSINLEKSKFGVKELPFLGYLLSTEGLRPNPEKVQAIVDYERPNTVTKLRRFLGMANYYRRFIDEFSGITSPLTDLLKTKSRIMGWNDAAEEAFNLIKEKLISAPILACPDFTTEFTVQTDASDVAVAGILTQVQDGYERVISFFSHKLTTPQRNYHACEKEALAVLLSIEAFRGYLEGSHFTVITDSAALTHILTAKWKTASRCSRWCLALQQFDMTVRHRRGKENVVADALSRSTAAIDVGPATPANSQPSPTLGDPDQNWYDDMIEKVAMQPDEFVDFQVREGVLFKYVTNPSETHDVRFDWKIVPHPKERVAIIRECHDDSMHPGVDRTLSRIRLRYFWPKMVTQIRDYISECTTCKETKAPNIALAPPMGEQRATTHPWQIIALDFIGPLPRSRKQNQYILSVVDLFSKWVMLVPFRKIDSDKLCQTLRDCWFFRNSVPEIVITDNATCFLSHHFRSLCRQFDVRHWLNSKYHSQANPVERVNRTVNAAIRTYVKTDQKQWDTKLSEVETVLNSSVHSATELTPFFTTHGHEMFQKGSDHRLGEEGGSLSVADRETRQTEMFNQIKSLVQENLKKAHEEGQKRYNLRHKTYAKPYEAGQLVFRRNLKQSRAIENYNAKYGPQYIPAKILRKIGTSSYEISDLDGKSLGVWPAAHLKPG